MLAEKLLDDHGAIDFEVVGNLSDDARQGTDAQIAMGRDRHVVLTITRRCQPHVAAGLAGHFVVVGS